MFTRPCHPGQRRRHRALKAVSELALGRVFFSHGSVTRDYNKALMLNVKHALGMLTLLSRTVRLAAGYAIRLKWLLIKLNSYVEDINTYSDSCLQGQQLCPMKIDHISGLALYPSILTCTMPTLRRPEHWSYIRYRLISLAGPYKRIHCNNA